RRLAYPLRSRTRFSEIVGAGGREPRGQFIDAAEEEATRELARELGLKTGAPLIRIESVRLADRAPICVSTTWLSAERFPDAGKVFANLRSMTKLLAHYGIRDFRRAATRITRIRNDTFCHSSTRICSANCRPMPPAPTIPMMVAERVFDSMK